MLLKRNKFLDQFGKGLDNREPTRNLDGRKISCGENEDKDKMALAEYFDL